MNKHYLQAKVKSTGMAYLLWFFLGAHYAYLGKWGFQFLYWFTFGGLGIWAIIDLFTMSGKIDRYNAVIFDQLEEIERQERQAERERNRTFASASN